MTMSLFPQEFHERAHQAIRVLGKSELPEIAAREVDHFFAKFAALERTRLAEAFITSLVLEKLSAVATQAPAQPTQERKVA